MRSPAVMSKAKNTMIKSWMKSNCRWGLGQFNDVYGLLTESVTFVSISKSHKKYLLNNYRKMLYFILSNISFFEKFQMVNLKFSLMLRINDQFIQFVCKCWKYSIFIYHQNNAGRWHRKCKLFNSNINKNRPNVCVAR